MPYCTKCNRKTVIRENAATHYSDDVYPVLCVHCEIISCKKIGDIYQTADGEYHEVTQEVLDRFHKTGQY